MGKLIEICTGSNMNGLDHFDIFKWCGLSHLSYEKRDKIFEHHYLYDVHLLKDCESIDYEVEAGEEIPCFTDEYYTFTVSSEEQLETVKRELREKILSLIEAYE